MMTDYIITIRNKKGTEFGNDIGPTSFLKVPPEVTIPTPDHIVKRTDWFDGLLAGFPKETNDVRCGNILAFIHGYDNTPENVLARQRSLRTQLNADGWDGTVLSFDWPSGDQTLKYLDDRNKAKDTAGRLVSELILPFITYRKTNCEININLLAHSMGGFLVRQAFVGSEDYRKIAEANWSIGQIVFVSADVSSSGFEPQSPDAACFQRHCARFTNYFNPYDSALKVSNVKRLGFAPRVGRIGLPENSAAKFVDVDCSARFKKLNEQDWRDSGGFGEFSHSWYFGDEMFSKDLAINLIGDIDRNYFPTRTVKVDNDLLLNAE